MDYSLSPIMEDYIETIFQLLKYEQVARVTDIAKRMQVTMSTVTSALRKLQSKKLINYSPYSTVSLTPNGKVVAEKIYRRHEVLSDFFQNVLALPPKKAVENACRIEHQIDDVLLERLLDFIEFVELCPNLSIKWDKKHGFKCMDQTVNDSSACVDCKKDISGKNGDVVEHSESSKIGLDELKPGEKGRIIDFVKKGPATKRMLEMGIIRGNLIDVERVAPLGDPIDIKVKGYHLSLRKEDAKSIIIERL